MCGANMPMVRIETHIGKDVSNNLFISVLRVVILKVKCPLVQALRLCTGRTAHRESRCIALPFLDHGTRKGWGVSFTPEPFFTAGKDPVLIVQEAGWAPGPVWTGAAHLAPTGIRSPVLPARSQSLYRLSYRAHVLIGPLKSKIDVSVPTW